MQHKYPLATETWGPEEYQSIEAVVKSGRFTMGEKVASFEAKFAQFTGAQHAVMVNSGSSANLLMVAALFFRKENPLKRGDEVIVPAVSWSTTYYPLQQYGLKVKFVDIDINTLNIDLVKLEEAMSEHTRAIFAVNLLGNPNDFAAISKLIGTRDIILLEDNCESMGAVVEGRQTGTFGLMGSFSTFFSHHISTMEGGVIITDDQELHHILLAIRAHGWTRNLPKHNRLVGTKSDDEFFESFRFVLPGYNVRPLEMSGALGTEQLKKLPSFVEKRRQNARQFVDCMTDHPLLLIQQEIGQSSWFGFSLVIRPEVDMTRLELLSKLRGKGFECRPIVAGNFAKNEVLKYFDAEISGELTAANHIDQFGLFIGNHHYPIPEAISALASL